MKKNLAFKVYIYENLPQGGAAVICNSLIKYFAHNNIPIEIISDKDIQPRNLAGYLYDALVTTTIRHKKIAKLMNNNGLLIANHSWLSKSPHLLRFYKGKKIYICHEVMREYYDPEHIKLHDIKDIVVNILRLPIKYLDKINVLKTNIIIANSNKSADLIKKAYGKHSQVIYPGIKIPQLNRIKKAPNQVITIGSLNKYKNILFLVKVIAKLEEEKRPKFIIIANGYDKAYRNKIINFANKHNVIIKILYNVSHKKLQTELAKSLVFLYSPISEPFGLVVLEAMAAGLPVLVNKNGGGYSEILSQENGVLLDSNNPKKWALKLTRMLEDSELLNKYGKYNQNYVKKYSKEVMNGKIFNLISQQLKLN